MTNVSDVAWIVDDDPVYANFVGDHLRKLSFHIRHFNNGESCLKDLQAQPDLIVVDHDLGEGINGLETLRRIKMFNPEIQVVYLSAIDDLSSAIAAIKYGALDYVEKDELEIARLKSAALKVRQLNSRMRRRIHSQSTMLALAAGLALLIIMIMLFVQ